MNFPLYRPRRLRRTEALRRLIRETELSPFDLILPLFAMEGKNVRNPISSMPGHFQFSVDNILREAREAKNLGIAGVILFGIPGKKDEKGSSAYDPKGPVQQAIREIKKAVPGLIVITDVCMCEYTSSGHCGIIKDGDVDNDQTLRALAKEALSHAKAGADMVAPSDMMDGRVRQIREALDKNGFNHIPIMSYAVKYASAFYGPFREAAESTPSFGDRKSYQMDPGNADEAIREAGCDIEEGADIVMAKPAMPCLDIIRRVKDTFGYPVAAYSVSGEYAMVKAAAKMGWIDGEKVMMEMLLSIKRAGADMIVTYFAKEAAALLKKRI